MMPPSGSGFIPARLVGYPTVDPTWIERLKRRQAAILQLSKGIRICLGSLNTQGAKDICAAVEYLLGAEIEEQLAQIASIEANPPRFPSPSIEDLDRAQREVEEFQAGLEAVDGMIAELPQAMKVFVEKVQRPMLAKQLESAQSYLSMIQRSIEETPTPTALAEISHPTETGSQTKGESD